MGLARAELIELEKNRKTNKNQRYRKAILPFFGLILSAVFFLPIHSEIQDYTGKTVSDIAFQGLINVSPSDLYPVLSIQKGQALQRESINLDVKSIFETGFFSDIRLFLSELSDGTIRVTFVVKELPRIREIEFRGVEELYSTDLRTALPFKEGSVYSAQKVLNGERVLENRYREEGFFLAEVWHTTTDLDPKTNSIDVTYIVDEGEDISVSRINIVGARNLDTDEIVGILEQKEEGLLEDGIFQESRYEQDKMRIVAFAKSQGFLDARVDESSTGYEIRWRNPSDPEEGRVVVITYTLVEGPIYYYGGYSLDHDEAYLNEELNPPERKLVQPGDLDPVYEPDVLLSVLEYTNGDTGKVFDETRYFRDRQQIQELYSQRGYVYAQVQPRFIRYELTEEVLDSYEKCLQNENPSSPEEIQCKQEAQWISLDDARERLEDSPEDRGRVLRHVHFTVLENSLAYIENIVIKGMVKTQEHVIRRELLVKEGQLFNSALVNRSREKLINTGFFKEVNLQMRPGSDDQKMNLIIDVQEQPTGTITMGGGYGTASGFSIFVEGGETNLNGTGQRISGKIQYGPETKQVSLSWTDPWFYESCEVNTGSFWRNQQKEFDQAENLDELVSISQNLQNNYRKYGRQIESYVDSVRRMDESDPVKLDIVKTKIRNLIHPVVETETDCYRSLPRPWALTLSGYYRSINLRFDSSNSIQISDVPNNYTYSEGSSYEITTVGVGFGTSHTFLINWAHYHRYVPSWSIATQPTALANDEIYKRVKLGWQFKSSFTNGIIYDTRDNVFNPTTGFNMDLSIETVGQFLGGQDHYNQYKLSFLKYWWWFDYTLWGFFRRNELRRWRVVQEFRATGIFMHETAPYYSDQDKSVNPYIEAYDMQLMGGYESLRGYYYTDSNYPAPWRDGANHMLLFGTELRFPVEPSILWIVGFLDAGALYDNIGEYTGIRKERLEEYDSNRLATRESTDPVTYWLSEYYNVYSNSKNFYGSQTDWDDPRNAVLSTRNVSLDRMMFSWGFGVRIQIPVLPLRLYLAQKLYYAGGGSFAPIPGDDEWEFVFGIGDYRF